MFAQLGLLVRSLPYLRWEQLVYRPIRWAQYRAYRARPFLTKRWVAIDKPRNEIPASTLSHFRQVFDTQWAHWGTPLREVESRLTDLKAGRFMFLHETRELATPDWNARYVSHLWNYQLSYHDYVVWLARTWVERDDESAWRRARALIESWIAQARISVSDGWDAYPLSLRIVHWIYAYALVVGRETDQVFLARWRTSIFQQLDFLSSHLEKHLLANHLFKNVKALVIGGLFFAHEPRGRKWLSRGEQLLARELAEQVLPDGGHYERSPMYHAQTLGDALECYALLKAFGRESANETMRQCLLRMADFLEAMSYTDGTLALFNDTANTFETRPAPLLESVRRICGERTNELPMSYPDTGYYLWQSADRREKIIVDAGEPSVSYNSAHVHCDLLSYELWLNGEPFIVDSGVHGYDGDRFREYCRSTRAHNTLMINDIEQSEVWGTFRVARRVRDLSAVITSATEQSWRFEGGYRDYRSKRRYYRRQIKRFMNGQWEVKEALKGPGKRVFSKAESFIHLHPSVEARVENKTIVCHVKERKILIETFGVTGIELVTGVMEPRVQGWWFPEFGKALPATTVTLKKNVLKVASEEWQAASELWEFGYRIIPC